MENKIPSLIMSKLTLSSLSCVSTDRCRYSFRLLEEAVPKALESAPPQTGSISFRLSRLGHMRISGSTASGHLAPGFPLSPGSHPKPQLTNVDPESCYVTAELQPPGVGALSRSGSDPFMVREGRRL